MEDPTEQKSSKITDTKKIAPKTINETEPCNINNKPSGTVTEGKEKQVSPAATNGDTSENNTVLKNTEKIPPKTIIKKKPCNINNKLSDTETKREKKQNSPAATNGDTSKNKTTTKKDSPPQQDCKSKDEEMETEGVEIQNLEIGQLEEEVVRLRVIKGYLLPNSFLAASPEQMFQNDQGIPRRHEESWPWQHHAIGYQQE